MGKLIVLLSGGLDSVVSLAKVKDNYSEILALTFNYGQKSYEAELKSAEKIAKFYNLKHQVVNLKWLNDISTSTLNTQENVPILNQTDLDNKNITQDSAKSVWVPNRNGLFVNIAGSFADALNYDEILIGANKEEGETFKDNSIEFIQTQNNAFRYSINKKVSLIAPLINLSKQEIIKEAIELNIPFELIHSCYISNDKHCGICESCQRLKRGLKLNNRDDIINKIFN